MVRFPGRKAHFLVLALLAAGVWLVATGPVLAGDKVEDKDDDEMQFMKLYFSEEQLVEAPTRAPRSIMQVAEDVTIVTAEEIEALHAHTLAEVLNRVPGTYLLFMGQDFGSVADPLLQGSHHERTLVLVDGVRWNMVSGGHAQLNDIPLGIIKQIEVIRGPASSTWGSSLGGVVNIITKDIGTRVQPTAQISGSWGESKSVDANAQVAGKAGRFGYFLYGGHQ